MMSSVFGVFFVAALLIVSASAEHGLQESSCLAGVEGCPMRDETSLFQVQMKSVPGTGRGTALSNEAGSSGEKDADMPSSRLGSFQYLKNDVVSGACEVHGIWQHGNMAPVSFHAQPSRVVLNIKDLPTLAVRRNLEVPNKTSGMTLTSVELDGISAYSDEDIASSDSLTKAFDAIIGSSFASKGAKKMSSLLGSRNLEGSQSTCALQLHMVLLSLAKLSHAEALDKNVLKDEPMPQCVEDTGGTCSSTTSFSPFSCDESRNAKCVKGKCVCTDGCAINGKCFNKFQSAAKFAAGNKAKSMGWWAKLKAAGKEWAWAGYGFKSSCPVDGPSNWQCKIGSNYYPAGDPHLSTDAEVRDNIKCEPTDKKIREADGCDAQDEKCLLEKECVGLCGAGCDCWESVCASDYMCVYNDVCCAHDLACSKFADGGRMAVRCIAFLPVMEACRAPENVKRELMKIDEAPSTN